jgi:hypothetical protein
MTATKNCAEIYRQYDGYPEGHGRDLAKLCDVTITNGIRLGKEAGTANGMGCLAAQIVMGLKREVGKESASNKNHVGTIYLEPARSHSSQERIAMTDPMFTDKDIRDAMELIQGDLMCVLDGMPDQLVTACCQVVVNRLNALIAHHDPTKGESPVPWENDRWQK